MFAVDEGPLQREIDEADHDAVLPDRDLAQDERNARHRLQQRERLAQPPLGLVDLVDEKKSRNALGFQFAHHELELRNFPRVRLADDDRRIDRGNRRTHFMGELDRARTIDEVKRVAEKFRRSDVHLHAHLVRAGLRSGIADARSRIHAAGTRNRARAGEDRFEQRSLPGLKWTDERDRARSLATYALKVFCPGIAANSAVNSGAFFVSHRHLPDPVVSSAARPA